MYESDPESDLTFLLHREVVCVKVCEYVAMMYLDECEISIEGEIIIDGENCTPFLIEGGKLLRFIGKRVSSAVVVGLLQIRLTFEDGSTIIFKNAENGYESVTIWSPKGLIVI